MPKRLLLSLFILLFSYLNFAYAMPTTNHLIRDDGSPVTYYLTRQKIASPSDTLLILLQGSECSSVAYDSTLNRGLSQVIPSADLLTVEKYGLDAYSPDPLAKELVFCPSSYIKYDSPSQRVRDVKQVLDRLQQIQTYKNIVVLGINEGGLIASRIASELPKVINAVISINSGGRYFIDDVLYRISRKLNTEEADTEQLAFIRTTERIQRENPEQLDLDNHGLLWWKDILSYDRQAILAQVTQPVLIISSGQEVDISIKSTKQMLGSLKNDDGKYNIRMMAYPNMNGQFINLNTGQSELIRVVEDIRVWLANYRVLQ
ncbi:alpha/beta hydrolase [Zophobihabitans entericus]|uniref:Alpha/beta hydrolase n=1 Tax=Zophobihabitans entericus TaxID=1635327 RepID=A0A6G9IAU8_9GAMM|nr:alpha/beta hydrolase [Zophobihabitans entericus]QIQ21351.1 alpha/beta hydrolase [Zophobihabitans entericus]